MSDEVNPVNTEAVGEQHFRSQAGSGDPLAIEFRDRRLENFPQSHATSFFSRSVW